MQTRAALQLSLPGTDGPAALGTQPGLSGAAGGADLPPFAIHPRQLLQQVRRQRGDRSFQHDIGQRLVGDLRLFGRVVLGRRRFRFRLFGVLWRGREAGRAGDEDEAGGQAEIVVRDIGPAIQRCGNPGCPQGQKWRP